MEPRLEEGLCELVAYLFLLSRLQAPPPHAPLANDAESMHQQIASIEANAHPDYGGGFRDCVDALRGRSLHELLAHVREHAALPLPIGALTAAGDPCEGAPLTAGPSIDG